MKIDEGTAFLVRGEIGYDELFVTVEAVLVVVVIVGGDVDDDAFTDSSGEESSVIVVYNTCPPILMFIINYRNKAFYASNKTKSKYINEE